MKNEELEKLKGGDTEAFSNIIDEFSNLVFKVSYNILNDRELSNECVNETFFKVWTHVKKFNMGANSFKNWICTIAKYTAIDILRKEKRHDNNLYIEDILEDIPINDVEIEDSIVIKQVIDELNEVDREIFIRKFYRDEKTSKIAKDMGISENSVYLRVSRAKKALAKKIKGDKNYE
ncbi:RNA polymerase sigma factor [uncultured Clostridium sp.]|uniref:RNA polymerase sigma factor n=1 Tax=uncultured Clostridium sp. TaxID=59620 RepID=UPI0026055CD8|nr:sigma-70 family RNA polymerase sigma factor [uncultured Clostridium sp.]